MREKERERERGRERERESEQKDDNYDTAGINTPTNLLYTILVYDNNDVYKSGIYNIVYYKSV